MNIFARVRSALLPLGLPAYPDKVIVNSGQTIPDEFLVYFMVANVGEQFADGSELLRQRTVQVTVYKRNGLTTLPNVKGAMITAGFQPGPERQIPLNDETGHYGWSMDFNYLEDAAEA